MDAFPPVSRRQLLLGAAGTLVLAACGKSDDDDIDAGDSTATSRTAESGTGGILALLIPPEQPVGVPLRLPLGLADKDGSFDVDLPTKASVLVRSPDGAMSKPVTVERHVKGLPRG